MARQTGLIKLKGTLDNVNFYKTKDGNLARMKTSVDAARIKNDPAFIRTRENGQEFGMAAKSGKLVRDAFRPMMMQASDGRVTSRLTKLMSDIRKLDTTSARGDRNVAIAIADPIAKEKLKGFNFNNRSILKSILFRPFSLDPGTGIIEITDLIPLNHIAAPQGATHISLTGAWGKLDFDGGVYEVEISNTENLPLTALASNVILTPNNAPAGTGIDAYLLLVEFFQEVNGIQYSLKDGQYNALSIVDVA